MHQAPDPEAVMSPGNLSGSHDGMDEQQQVELVVPVTLVLQPALETMLRMYALPCLGFAELTAMRLSCRWVHTHTSPPPSPSSLPLMHACAVPSPFRTLQIISWFTRRPAVSLIDMITLTNSRKSENNQF